MRKTFAVLASCAFALASSWAQTVIDPNDAIYRDLDRWANRGYVSRLPPVRPYPPQLLDELLNRVVAEGDVASAEKAQGYLDAIAPGSRPIHVGARGLIRGLDDDLTIEGAPTLDGTIRVAENLSASYAGGLEAVTRLPGSEIEVPGVWAPHADLIEDQAKVGPFYLLQDWTSNIAAGNPSLYFQAGLNRTSFGPFFDNGVVVGPQAGRAGHFSAVYRKEAWSVSMLLLELSASNDFGEKQFPDKHLILHTIDFSPTKDLEIGIFESVMYGGRFEFQYLAPFNMYFASQSLTGFEDNSLLGVHAKWSATPGFQLIGQFYLDDMSFNDIVRLNLDTKYKFASELGLRWTPSGGPLADLAADYTAVMPYMYSHVTGGDRGTDRYSEDYPNYFNYSHLGRSLGADLEPNSDRLSVRSSWKIARGVEVGANAALYRHGNASEGVADLAEANHDGTIYDDGYYDTSLRFSSQNETRFLTQSVIETKAQAGTSLRIELPSPFGSFWGTATYTLEYGWNRDLVENDDSLVHFWSLGGGWRW
ncbi:MAG: hypothetical protein A2413_18845 [Treponema sp. RIFOXYC1_FULL_61_9]|nr:MAG: hypothetical protein A2413_18845 [Treponema sp. RIFOXYC1_FULL_61_9]